MSQKISNISKYLDSTFLKTSVELNISKKELEKIIISFVNEAVEYNFKCVMIRSNYVSLAKSIISDKKSNVIVGTVVDFPLGTSCFEQKIKEAKEVLKNGAQELDYVCDYNSFKMGELDSFDESILKCTKIGLEANAVVKWIVETGALSKSEIKSISKRLYDIILKNFPDQISKVFVKTSTGYYGGLGATIKDIKSIKSVVADMPIKASGGISDLDTCLKMIDAGADRIGTSKASIIYKEWRRLN